MSNVTVITRWETGQMSPLKEWKMWRQLRGAFGINRFIFVPKQDYMEGHTFEQYDTMEEALSMLDDEVPVFLEPKGRNTMHEMCELHGKDIALVLGNTHDSNMNHARPAQTYRIETPGSTDMYGTNAAAIALALWYGQ